MRSGERLCDEDKTFKRLWGWIVWRLEWFFGSERFALSIMGMVVLLGLLLLFSGSLWGIIWMLSGLICIADVVVGL